jgi:hypothetical protein
MWIKNIDYLLAALALAGHLLLMAVLIRRRLGSRLLFFTALIAFYLLRSAVFLVVHSLPVATWIVWTLIGLDPVLQCLLYVAIVHSWRPCRIEPPRARILANCALLTAAVGFAGLVAWHTGPSSHFSPTNLSIKAGVFVSVLWIEAGIGQAALKGKLARQAPELAQKIVRGFAIYSFVNVVTEIGRSYLAAFRSEGPYLAFSYLRITAYLVCLAFWIIAFLREPRGPERALSKAYQL